VLPSALTIDSGAFKRKWLFMAKLRKQKKEIIKRAGELAVKYEAQYKGCGQCTFLAIADALKWGGLEIIPEVMDEKFFAGTGGFTGGTSMVIDGTCGAIISGMLAMGLALGSTRESQNEARLRGVCATIRSTLLDRFYAEYGSILCRDILNKYFGRVWDLTDDEASNDFLKVSHGCAIMQTVSWTTEIILDEFEKGNVKPW
jgi:hypothetical protein